MSVFRPTPASDFSLLSLLASRVKRRRLSPIPALTHSDSCAGTEKQRGSRGLEAAPRHVAEAVFARLPGAVCLLRSPFSKTPPGPSSAMHNAGVKMLTVANKNQRGCPHKSEPFRSTFHLRVHQGGGGGGTRSCN